MKLASNGGLAVVTGGGGGLGSSYARKLADRGYRLLLVDRRAAQLEQVCDSIAADYGVAGEPYLADLCNREQVVQLAKRLEQSNVEVLVNNAGFGTVDYFIDTDPKCLADMADVHVVASLLLSRAARPSKVEHNRGAIINMSSLSAWFRSAGNAAYGSMKCLLAVFSSSLQQELRGTGVRVQALCPGLIR